MIKRDGVEVMNARTQNVKLAKETLAIIKQKQYTNLLGQIVDISQSLDAAISGTVLYPDPLPNKHYQVIKPTIEITNETTAQAAVRLLAVGKQDIVALNFASARNPGGGFLAGALAQEEDLCRCSGLYACTKSKPMFYNANILCEDTLYTDGIIYSPKVPFIRDEHNLFLDAPFELSIISAPAPNIRSIKDSEADHPDFDQVLYSTLLGRAKKILQVAETHGHKNIILGAWGCGAFGNDPQQVACVFDEALNQVPVFEHICFAVYDAREPPLVYEAFKMTLELLHE